MPDIRGTVLYDSVRFELQVPIPHKRHDDGSVNGDACICLPSDPLVWKQEFVKHLERDDRIFLTLTDGYGGDFALTFSLYPDKDVAAGLEDGTAFGFTMERHTMEALWRAISFALQENAI